MNKEYILVQLDYCRINLTHFPDGYNQDLKCELAKTLCLVCFCFLFSYFV